MVKEIKYQKIAASPKFLKRSRPGATNKLSQIGEIKKASRSPLSRWCNSNKRFKIYGAISFNAEFLFNNFIEQLKSALKAHTQITFK